MIQEFPSFRFQSALGSGMFAKGGSPKVPLVRNYSTYINVTVDPLAYIERGARENPIYQSSLSSQLPFFQHNLSSSENRIMIITLYKISVKITILVLIMAIVAASHIKRDDCSKCQAYWCPCPCELLKPSLLTY